MMQLNFPSSYGDLKTTSLPLLAESSLQLFLQAKAELPQEITVLDPIKPADGALTLYVSPDGSDSASGEFDAPLLTLTEALARARGGARILLREGTYTLKETVRIGEEHSGTESSPLFISAYQGESVTLTSGKEIPASAFMTIDEAVAANVISSAMRDRLNAFSDHNSDHIVVADLKTLGFDADDMPPLSTQGPDYLMVNGKTQTLARFPHKGLGVTMGRTVYNVGPCAASYSHLYAENKDNRDPWMTSYPEDAADHIRRWASYEDVWMYGALYQEWHRIYYKLNVDPVKETLSSDNPCGWGVCFAEKNTVYFYNVPEELTEPGEWYLDRKEGKLYLYPDTDTNITEASVVLATKQHDLLAVNDAKNVVLDGLSIMGSGGKGVYAVNCDSFVIQNCKLGNFGSSAAVIERSIQSGALYSSFTHTNQTMLSVQGRSQCPTEPDRNFIQNCLFFNPVIKYGLSFGCMGGVVSHNEIRDSLLCFSGSENVIEYNRLDGGAYNTTDSGPIYCSCLNIKFNNHIRYNYLYNMRKGVYGIYLDDLTTGNFVYGNLIVYPFVNPPASGRGVNIHSGKNNVVFNNVVFNAYQGATNSLNYYMHAGDHRWAPSLHGAIKAFSSLDEALLDRRYPQIKAFLELLKINAKERESENFVRYINEDAARIPSGTVYTRNLFVNCKEPVSNHYLVEFCSYILNNYATDTAEGLGFADPEGGDFTLSADSPVFDLIPGFEATDFKRIGRCCAR